jgi:hypothetical protein
LSAIREASTLVTTPTAASPARQYDFAAKTRPFSWWVLSAVLLNQIAANLAAAWLVWARQGKMTWGYFLYIIWFNPGQSFTNITRCLGDKHEHDSRAIWPWLGERAPAQAPPWRRTR